MTINLGIYLVCSCK